jgi:hypothetical protein
MSIAIVEKLMDRPFTPENLIDLRLRDCLTERNVTWRYSLLSSDRH